MQQGFCALRILAKAGRYVRYSNLNFLGFLICAPDSDIRKVLYWYAF